MKRILLSLGAIVFVGAVAAGATGAFFSDTETSTGNTFTAGSLDLKVDSQCHYFQNGKDVRCTNPGEQGPVSFGNWEQTDLIPGVHKFFDFGDIKPGDRGESTISLHVYDNDAWGTFHIVSTTNDSLDNTCTEPELEAEPGCQNNNVGELAGAMTTTVWLDQGSIPGFQNVGPTGVAVDANPQQEGIQKPDPTEGDNILQEGETILVSGAPFFNTNFNLWTVLADAREATGEVCDNAPVDGHVQGDGVPYGTCNGLAVDGRMDGSTTYYIGWQWDLPSNVGNEVQTDSIKGDVVFNVVQHRNNPGHNF